MPYARAARDAADDIDIVINIGGKVHKAQASLPDGYILFSELPVNVSRNPVVQIQVNGACKMWKAHLGLHGGEMKEVYQASRPGVKVLNLYGLMKWQGDKTVDLLLQFKEDINVVAFDLSDCAEKDVVLEDAREARAVAFGCDAGSPYCFVETGLKQKDRTAYGLPRNRMVPSSDVELGAYMLLPYDGPNIIELQTSAFEPGETHVIDVPNGRYSKIGILTASVHGDTSFTLTLIYEDGTAVAQWFESDDWYRKSRASNIPLLEAMDWANVVERKLEDVDHFQLYEVILTDIDTDQKLDKVAVGNDPHRWPDSEERSCGVFAVNGHMAWHPALKK